MQEGTEKPRRGRGRPRAYDSTTVAVQIVDTFWRHGFAATSLDQLATATGLNRPSLYGAFGDKKQMYRRALELFAAQARAEIAQSLAAPVLAEALHAFYKGAIAIYRSGSTGPRGCLFVCTATVEAVDDADIRGDVSRMLQTIDAALAARFAAAQAEGDLSSAIAPADLAGLASAVLHSLAVRARSGASRGQLERLADTAVAMLAGTAPARRATRRKGATP